ncbi:MAG: hypothetical protein R6W83_12165 [Cryobacterium sp.]
MRADRGVLRAVPPGDGIEPDAVWDWLRGMLPTEISQCAEITCDSWNNPRLRVHILTDADGQLIVANRAVLREVMRIIYSGATVVVQVCSTDETAGRAAPATIRIWLFNRHGPRAVEADTVQDILLPDERNAYSESGAHFETGWRITGEPGGGMAARRGDRAGSAHQPWWPTATQLRA